MTLTSEPTLDNAPVVAAIRDHHSRLAGELHRLTTALLTALRAGQWSAEQQALHDWYRTELVPHAVAEEHTLYRAAADDPRTTLLVQGMLDEHRALVSQIADLALGRDAVHTAGSATAAEALFTVHLTKENDLLLPALDAAGADLAALLEGMHQILGDTEGAAGSGDSGCGCGCGHDDAPIQITTAPVAEGELDVRALPHGQRHEIIFAKLDALRPGEALVIVNDHDPKPLRYQTSALWPERFEWTYREAGPAVWRVAITCAG